MKIFKIAKKYLFKYKLYLCLYTIICLILWGLSLVQPYITSEYIDNLTNFKEIQSIYYYTFIVFLIGLSNMVLSYIKNMILIKFQSRVAFDMNYDVIEHIKRMPFSYLSNVDTIYLNQRVNSDVNTIINFILNNYISIVANIINIIVLIYLLIKIDLDLSMLLLILMPLYIITYILFKKPLYVSGYKMKEEQTKFFSKLNEQLYNIKFIKTNSLFDILGNKLKDKFQELLKSVVKYSNISYLFYSFDSIIGSISQVIIFLYGGIKVINKEITLGQFTIINTYFMMIIGSISYYLSFGKSYQDSNVSYSRIIDILKIKEDNNGSIVLKNIDQIVINNLYFNYKNKSIFNNFNYKFKKGNTYCIVGDNGTGKSTLASLILGLYIDDFKGEILYNETDIKKINLYEVRKKLIGVTEQEPILLCDTILNNLCYGLKDIGDEVVNYWIDRLELKEFVKSLDGGLNYNINEKSNNISGGEKQKLSLIRTLIKNPDVLILDEPTSALDTLSINKIKNILNEIKKDKIILIITHNKDMLEIADDTIYLKSNFDIKS